MEAKVETSTSSNYNALKHVYKRCRISCIHCSNRHCSSDIDGGVLLMFKILHGLCVSHNTKNHKVQSP